MEAAEALTGPAPTQSVAELRAGQPFAGRFACVRKDRMTGRNGAPYLAVELRDRTGTIAARVFRDADRLAGRFERGDAVFARGRAQRYRGELSAEIDDVRRLEPGSWDPAEFLPVAYRSIAELNGFFEHLASEVHDAALRDVVERVAGTEPVLTELRKAPCSRAGHHAYVGGLLEHTVAVGTLVLELCQLHPRIDSDLLMAAALLHDVGRTREFTYGAEFGITDEGRMLGHLTLGAEIVGAAAGGLPAERRVALLHCILSHHGPEAAGRSRGAIGTRSGFGSAEALALYRLNALDAGVKGALEQGL
ncbi:MAG TPA: HD domain-containing protein [Solirubrobacterales bacterium]